MYLSADKVTYALEIASRILKHPRICDENGPRIPISVEDLFYAVEDMSGHKINGREVDFDADFLKGRIERYDNKTANVDVRLSLGDLSLMRLVASKEVVHLLVDQDDDLSPYGDRTLEILVEEGHIGVLTTQHGQASASQSELIAEIVAQEVLWPIKLRLKDLHEDIEPSKFSRVMAERYGIPLATASSMTSGSYAQFLNSAFENSK